MSLSCDADIKGARKAKKKRKRKPFFFLKKSEINFFIINKIIKNSENTSEDSGVFKYLVKHQLVHKDLTQRKLEADIFPLLLSINQ